MLSSLLISLIPNLVNLFLTLHLFLPPSPHRSHPPSYPPPTSLSLSPSLLFSLTLSSHLFHHPLESRARVLVPIDLGTIASETKMSFYGTDHALFAKVTYHAIHLPLIHHSLTSTSPLIDHSVRCCYSVCLEVS